MKRRKEVNTLRAIWGKMIIDGNLCRIAKEYRVKIGIPENGFNYVRETYKNWLDKNIGNNKVKEQNRVKVCTQFCNKIIHKIPPKYLVSETKLRLLLINFFFNGSIETETITLDDGLFGVFETLLIENEKRRFPKEKIRDGIYIKIGPYSSIDSIKKYIIKNTKLIKEIQEGFLLSKKLPLSFKLYSSKNHNRDTKIERLNSFTKQDLKELFCMNNEYKESQIACIMNRWGYKEVDDKIVKIVLNRRRKAKNQYLKLVTKT